jgi:hypothetical protein
MAAYILSPERWRELSAASSPSVVAEAGQQQTPQAVGPGIRRRISRVFYEAHHTPGNQKKNKMINIFPFFDYYFYISSLSFPTYNNITTCAHSLL